MDLPSSKLSWHKRFISEGSGSCPSPGATDFGSTVPASSSTAQGRETAWAREETMSRLWAHVPVRAGGETESAQMGKGGEPAVPRGEPGRRRVQRRFSAGDPVPGERAGAIAREEAGELKGGSNFAICDWEGADHGGVAGLRGGSRRR
jgi:hypothetical protein